MPSTATRKRKGFGSAEERLTARDMFPSQSNGRDRVAPALLAGHETELKTLQMGRFFEARNAPWSRFCVGVAQRGRATRRLEKAFNLNAAGLVGDRVLP